MIPNNPVTRSNFHNFGIKNSTSETSLLNFKVSQEQPKINIIEGTSTNISFTEENMPTLQSHMGNSIEILNDCKENGESAELCSLKINTGHLHGEFYSQWE